MVEIEGNGILLEVKGIDRKHENSNGSSSFLSRPVVLSSPDKDTLPPPSRSPSKIIPQTKSGPPLPVQ